MRKIIFVLLLACVCSPIIAQNSGPRACRSVHLRYPSDEGIVYYNEVTVEKSYPATYFCVCGFNHGYFGIQELWEGKKVVIFSVWDPGNQNNPDIVPEDRKVKVLYEGKDVKVSRFGNEGTGGKSMFDYDWKVGRTYRCMVKAVVEGDRTSYTAFFYLNDEKQWKKLATFQTITGGDYLKGYYLFVEDFWRNGKSAAVSRRASYGNGWIKDKTGLWKRLEEAQFTADRTQTMNINAGVDSGRFFLQTGGETKNETDLWSKMKNTAGFTQPQDPQWKLDWNDEFNGAGLIDAGKWGYEKGFIRNREKQYYTEARVENARMEDGSLVIESRKEKYEGKAEYTSASVNTRGKKDFLYGRFEIRAKLPTGRGMWPAIWMLGINRQLGWPACGELDIMENVGYDPELVHANIHTKAYNHVKGTNKGDRIKISEPWKDFHLYAMEWFQDHIDFFVDGKKYFTYENEGTGNDVWPFDKPHYLLLNAAIGGSWGGSKGIDDSIFPQKYYIDFVRYYRQEE